MNIFMGYVLDFVVGGYSITINLNELHKIWENLESMAQQHVGSFQWAVLKSWKGCEANACPTTRVVYTVVKVDGATPKRWLSKGQWQADTWELRHLLSYLLRWQKSPAYASQFFI